MILQGIEWWCIITIINREDEKRGIYLLFKFLLNIKVESKHVSLTSRATTMFFFLQMLPFRLIFFFSFTLKGVKCNWQLKFMHAHPLQYIQYCNRVNIRGESKYNNKMMNNCFCHKNQIITCIFQRIAFNLRSKKKKIWTMPTNKTISNRKIWIGKKWKTTFVLSTIICTRHSILISSSFNEWSFLFTPPNKLINAY